MFLENENTPTQLQTHRKRKELWAKINAKAVPDLGICLRKKPPEPKPLVVPPKPIIAQSITPDDDLAEQIILILSDLYKINAHLLLQDFRAEKYVRPRHIVMYFIRTLAKLSFPKIGRMFGKNHTSVMHAVDLVKHRMENDPVYKDHVEEVQSILLGV